MSSYERTDTDKRKQRCSVSSLALARPSKGRPRAAGNHNRALNKKIANADGDHSPCEDTGGAYPEAGQWKCWKRLGFFKIA